MSRFTRFLAAFVVYTVIDMAWSLSPPAVAMHARLHEASGNDWSFGKPMDTWGAIEIVALLVFFALIALANSQLAIAPAVRERNLQRAMKNAFVLGCAAYATYSVPIFAAIANWPAALIPIDILTGGLLSFSTSTIVTWWALRRHAA
ncbi:MAG: DUF2177 family protein [Acidobacteria bacterium]|nr:DUF2177 family protein [Acidobacteriota bacterium]